MRDSHDQGEHDRLVGLLCSLHEAATEKLERYRRILDREREAVLSGRVRHLRELAGLEAEQSKSVAAAERSLAAFERWSTGGIGGSLRPALERSRAAHEEARQLAREGLRLLQGLLEAELRRTARELVALRSRVGTPSPFSAIGEAAFLDLRR